MKERVLLMIGGILLILLGIARGSGGVILLLQGPAADPRIRASHFAVAILGALLAVLGLGLIASGVGVLRRRRRGWVWGVSLVVAFVMDGLANGYVFFGRPGDRGTVANLLAAALILACLYLGRRALGDGRVTWDQT